MAAPFTGGEEPEKNQSLRHLSVVANERARGEYDRIVGKLRAAGYLEVNEQVGDDFKCLCPVHENAGRHAPSLHVTKKEDGGAYVMCFGSCSRSDVYWGVMAEDAVLPKCRAEKISTGGDGGWLISSFELDNPQMYYKWCSQESSDRGPWESAVFVYRGVDGREVAAKIKWSSKNFTWLHKSGGRWMRGLDNTTVPLYRVDEITDTGRETVVYAVEGEKDADRLWEDGLVATSIKYIWKSGKSPGAVLEGRVVVVIPDNDDRGRADAMRFANMAYNAGAAQVRLMPALGGEDAPEGYDVSDWLDSGGTIEELERMASDDSAVKIWDADDASAGAGSGTGLGDERGSGDGVPGGDGEEVVDGAGGRDDDEFIGGIPGLTPELIADKQWSPSYVNQVVRALTYKSARSDADELYLRLLSADGSDGIIETEVDWDKILDDTSPDVAPPGVFRLLEGQALFYEGVVNTVFGYGGHGKSMIMAAAVAQELIAGRHAAYFTYELPPRILAARLMAMGVEKEAIRSLFHVYQSQIGVPRTLLDKWPDTQLVVVDSTNKALIAHELDSDKVGGFGKLNNVLLRPCTDAGMTIVTIDHVTQNAENRNRMIGSVEKWNAIQGAAYKIERGREFSLVQSGWSSIQLMKDNPSGTGWTADQTIGYLVVEANGLGQGRSKIWAQCGSPVSADQVSDLSRLAGQNASAQEVKRAEAEQRENAMIMVVMENPGVYNKSGLAEYMASTYGGSGSTWHRVMKKLTDSRVIEAGEDGTMFKVSEDVEYDPSAEIA